MASKEWSNHYHLIQYQLFLQRQWNIIVRVNIIYYVIICMKGDDVHEEVLRIILNRWVWGWKLIFQLVRWFPSHISRLLPIFFGQCDISPSNTVFVNVGQNQCIQFGNLECLLLVSRSQQLHIMGFSICGWLLCVQVA